MTLTISACQVREDTQTRESVRYELKKHITSSFVKASGAFGVRGD
jgi:hypothetical protein